MIDLMEEKALIKRILFSGVILLVLTIINILYYKTRILILNNSAMWRIKII